MPALNSISSSANAATALARHSSKALAAGQSAGRCLADTGQHIVRCGHTLAAMCSSQECGARRALLSHLPAVRSSMQNQMDITKLVPEIVLLDGLSIGLLNMITAGQCLEHRQMCGARLMQPGQQSSHTANPTLRCDYHVRPAFSRMNNPILVRHGLKGAHDGGANSDHPPAGSTRSIHHFGRLE